MKRFILSTAFVAISVLANSQDNMACYLDTSLVDQLYIRQDTVWVVKPEFQKGSWNLYWDFALTKIKTEVHYNTTGGKIGIWREYYKNGQMASEWNYDGALNQYYPTGKEWFWNGKLKTERTQSADSVMESRYHANGKISSVNKWDKTGKWVLHQEWCDNGQLVMDYNPTSDIVLPVKKYHCNGKLKAEYNWYAYGYVGAYKEYFSNGKVSVEGQYTEKPADKAVFVARKTGTWTYYDDKGKVTKKEKWDNGRLVGRE